MRERRCKADGALFNQYGECPNARPDNPRSHEPEEVLVVPADRVTDLNTLSGRWDTKTAVVGALIRTGARVLVIVDEEGENDASDTV